jgi:hypothetical protein
MPRKDTEPSKAAQRLAEELKRLADDPDHPLRKIGGVNPPDDHPLRKINRELANLPEDHPFQKMFRDAQRAAQRLAERDELERRKLEAKANTAVKKKTKPPLKILHLDEALNALEVARRNDPGLRTSLKAAANWIMTDKKHGVRVLDIDEGREVPLSDTHRRTLERRILDRFPDTGRKRGSR